MDSVSGYVNHSLNTSQTKAAFSFPREGRLGESKTYKYVNEG